MIYYEDLKLTLELSEADTDQLTQMVAEHCRRQKALVPDQAELATMIKKHPGWLEQNKLAKLENIARAIADFSCFDEAISQGGVE